MNQSEEFLEYLKEHPFFSEEQLRKDLKGSEPAKSSCKKKIWPYIVAGASGFVIHWAASTVAHSGSKAILGAREAISFLG